MKPLKTKILFSLLSAVLVAGTLTGCFDLKMQRITGLERDVNPAPTDYDAPNQAKALKKTDLTIGLAHFSDKRGLDSFVTHPGDAVLYEYDTEKLTRGTAPFMNSMLEKHLRRIAETYEPDYMAEIEMTHLRTYIESGNLWSGRMGKYVVEMHGNVLVRDKTSNVLVQATLEERFDTPRKAVDGRHPNVAQDRKNILSTLDTAVRDFSVKTYLELQEKIDSSSVRFFDRSTLRKMFEKKNKKNKEL